MSVQEAVDPEKSPQLARLFSSEILGRLPTTGYNRLRRTALGAIGQTVAIFQCEAAYIVASFRRLLVMVYHVLQDANHARFDLAFECPELRRNSPHRSCTLPSSCRSFAESVRC